MNRYLLCLLILTSCSEKKAVDINDLEKKQTFIKILGFVKANRIDSVRKYYPYQYENDSAGFNNTMQNAKIMMDECNSGIVMDSIFIIDSSYVLSENKYFHDYYLRFYKDTIYLGGIKMDFFGNMNNCVSVIQTDKHLNAAEMNDLVDSLNATAEKILKESEKE
jgi:hypothetical protein